MRLSGLSLAAILLFASVMLAQHSSPEAETVPQAPAAAVVVAPTAVLRAVPLLPAAATVPAAQARTARAGTAQARRPRIPECMDPRRMARTPFSGQIAPPLQKPDSPKSAASSPSCGIHSGSQSPSQLQRRGSSPTGGARSVSVARVRSVFQDIVVALFQSTEHTISVRYPRLGAAARAFCRLLFSMTAPGRAG